MKMNIRRVQDSFPYEVVSAMKEEGDVELREMDRKVPKKTGDLASTGRVEGPALSLGWYTLLFIYGGVADSGNNVDYAVPVHENLDVNHPNGEAKWMESTLRESAPYFLARVAARISLERAMRG